MNRDHYPMYVIAGAIAVGLVWAGMPAVFLSLLVCPLMMFFMMKGMGGMHTNLPAPPPVAAVKPPADDPERR